MADLIFDQIRLNIGQGFDWTSDPVKFVLLLAGVWVPAETDVYIGDVIVAGATEASTGSPGYGGTNRRTLTSPTVALSAGAAFWDGDNLSYPGVPNLGAFDSLVAYRAVTSDADSWLMGYWALGAQTGDGAAITINPNASGFFQW